jgi:hypothetical protein
MKDEQNTLKAGHTGIASEQMAAWGITPTVLVQITDDGVSCVEIDKDFNSTLYTDTGLCGGPCYLMEQQDIIEGWLNVPQDAMVGEPQPGFKMEGIGIEEELKDIFSQVGIMICMENGAYDTAYFVASDEQLVALLSSRSVAHRREINNDNK